MRGIFIFFFLIFPAISNETWPRFRGEDGIGVSSDSLPTRPGKNTLLWSAKLPGPGSSSPVIWKDKLFITGEDREKKAVTLVCLDSANGKTLWKHPFEVGQYHLHRFNNTAAATPAANANLVVAPWFDGQKKTGMLTAFTHEGKKIWEANLGPFPSQHGFNLHPVIHKDRVVISPLHMEKGYVAALSLADGKLIWKRPYAGEKTSYVTPLIRTTTTGSEVIVASQANGVFAIDLATGRENWALPETMKQRTIVSPIDVLEGSGSPNSLVAVGCKNGVYFAVEPPKKGGESATIAWRMEGKTPYVPTPVSNGRMVFAVSDGGTLTALEAATGRTQWTKELQGNFYASPILAAGKLYALTREGELIVAEVEDGFKEVSRSVLRPDDEPSSTDATPAVAHGKLYLRLGSQLECHGNKL